ncbi:serine protease [Arthrobacter sp. UYEF20]
MAPVASAASDITGPVLVSSTVTPKSLNIATGPAAVKITVRLTDRTGTSDPVLSVSHDGTGQSHGFGRMTLVSGTAKDGTWERSVAIPKGSATGNWTVTLFPLTDTLGNGSGGFRDLATLTVTGTPSDIAGPVLVSSTVTPKSLNIATGPATVKITVRLTDRTGTSDPVLSVSHDGTGQSHGFGRMTLLSGTAKDGTWERSVAIPKGSATGNWTVTLFPLSDTLGNGSGGFLDLATLNVTATIPKLSLTAAPVPIVAGTTKVGSTLTAAAGTWSPAPVTLSYQWYRSGVAITGATAATYKPTASDAGKTMTVRVTGSKSGYSTAARTSVPTATITARALTAPTPSVTGTVKVGSTLTAAAGTWSPAPVTLSYQWYRSGAAITGATAATKKLTASDTGKTMTVRITGTKTGFTTATKTSAATRAVAG